MIVVVEFYFFILKHIENEMNYQRKPKQTCFVGHAALSLWTEFATHSPVHFWGCHFTGIWKRVSEDILTNKRKLDEWYLNFQDWSTKSISWKCVHGVKGKF